MRQLDRRNWLKTVGLSGGFALFSGLESWAADFPGRPFLPAGPIRLNANENPYGPSRKVRETIISSLDEACRYPFRALSGLVDGIAKKEGVTRDHVVVTGGSTEGLRAAGLTYGIGNGEIISADPTFHVMMQYAETFGARIHRIPVNEEMLHDLEGMAQKVNQKTKLIFICNPNNPTGTILERNKLVDFCTSFDTKTTLFVDEAYYDFITEAEYPSMIDLVKKGRNVIVSKTFSKVYGLAGLRVGYLIAKPEIAVRLKASVMANTNILAIEAAKAALKDDEFYKFSLLKTEEAKRHIYNTLQGLGLHYIPSHTNFIFFRTGRPIQSLISAMQKEHVFIGRPFPPFLKWARISTGTMEETAFFGKALIKVMA
ncbi:histidinol-phosphate transaminase [Ulvibacterium sp.]|uniref:pyridoxal phosphate-dependent aminotransferase n=1 Tax=Ulvibacterium sp. TaxID=2665914 RepID=UPI00260E328E|nr:histidinol-phosphate transaminase [Ulvibacterium sp.]